LLGHVVYSGWLRSAYESNIATLAPNVNRH
jgi:hypothetical protein